MTDFEFINNRIDSIQQICIHKYIATVLIQIMAQAFISFQQFFTLATEENRQLLVKDRLLSVMPAMNLMAADVLQSTIFDVVKFVIVLPTLQGH